MKTTTPERQTLERVHSEIVTSEIFRTDGAKIDLPAKLIELADAISADPDEDENIWYVGEYSSASLDSLVVGAYWSLTEWHGGQSSDTYAALCALGRIIQPGYTSAPVEGEETADWDAYNLINKHFESLSVAGL